MSGDRVYGEGPVARDRQAEARSLAEELLADIELSRLGAEQVLLKSVRLARLIDDAASLRWLQLELNGYRFTNETRPALRRMNRITKDSDGKEIAYVNSLGSIEASICAQEARLNSLKAPSLSGEYLGTALDRVHMHSPPAPIRNSPSAKGKERSSRRRGKRSTGCSHL